MTFAAALFCSMVIAYVIVLNVWYNQERAGMTPEEREQERRDMNIW